MRNIKKNAFVLLSCTLLLMQNMKSQTIIDSIDLSTIPSGSIAKYWLKMTENGLSQPITVPVLIAKGVEEGPVLGLAAALHGNELNGIPVIQQTFQHLDPTQLKGAIIAIPGINAISLLGHRRRFVDEEDLNRNFPGKPHGNRSLQYVWQINKKFLSKIDYLLDMHTASFGRTNTLYVRADMNNEVIAGMARAQDADIILHNKGIPSVGKANASSRTMRAEAMLKGKPTITIEYGNPQVYQPEMIERGIRGVNNTLIHLGMLKGQVDVPKTPVSCQKSYWLYVDKGGYLEIPVTLGELVSKGQTIGILRDPFGDVIKAYKCPEDGIVIGKSSNPVNMSGGRILHLGIME